MAMSMIYEVRWTHLAREDLVDIHNYYTAEVDSKLADQIMERIGDEVNFLQVFAMRTRPGRLAGTRELVLTTVPYIACVVVEEQIVHVIGIIHSSQKYPTQALRARLH
jgi:toxin ParE1/3/4